jgi:hypothetical protein
MTAPESMLRMLEYVFIVRPLSLLELTLAQPKFMAKRVSGRLKVGLSTRRFYGFFAAQEEHVL